MGEEPFTICGINCSGFIPLKSIFSIFVLDLCHQQNNNAKSIPSGNKTGCDYQRFRSSTFHSYLTHIPLQSVISPLYHHFIPILSLYGWQNPIKSMLFMHQFHHIPYVSWHPQRCVPVNAGPPADRFGEAESTLSGPGEKCTSVNIQPIKISRNQ